MLFLCPFAEMGRIHILEDRILQPKNSSNSSIDKLELSVGVVENNRSASCLSFTNSSPKVLTTLQLCQNKQVASSSPLDSSSEFYLLHSSENILESEILPSGTNSNTKSGNDELESAVGIRENNKYAYCISFTNKSLNLLTSQICQNNQQASSTPLYSS